MPWGKADTLVTPILGILLLSHDRDSAARDDFLLEGQLEEGRDFPEPLPAAFWHPSPQNRPVRLLVGVYTKHFIA